MMDYKAAGVDVTAGYASVELIKGHIGKTVREGAVGGIGGFGGLFSLKAFKGLEEPVLVSGTDGVGTKIKIAMELGIHDTIGVDCVAMCVNDIICAGAEPLFFLDYIACGKNFPEKIEQIVKGVADGCVMAGCALVGGETAEHPGIMPETDYDLAGFAVGVVERAKIIDGSGTRAGDVLIGLASSGLHSNGFSLVRKLLPPRADLLKPTRIYVKAALSLIRAVNVKGISHITGGGFIENIPRAIPEGLKAAVRKGTWAIPPVFAEIQKLGNISEKDMYNTFNMGIGLVVTVSKEDVDKAAGILRDAGETPYVIGEVGSGSGIEIC